MVKSPYDSVVECGACEIAFVDFFSAIVLQVGQYFGQKLELFLSFSGGQSWAAVEHVVVGVYPESYKAAFAAEEFQKPVGHDLIVGIDYDGFDPIDIKLHMRETIGKGRHSGHPGDLRDKDNYYSCILFCKAR